MKRDSIYNVQISHIYSYISQVLYNPLLLTAWFDYIRLNRFSLPSGAKHRRRLKVTVNRCINHCMGLRAVSHRRGYLAISELVVRHTIGLLE